MSRPSRIRAIHRDRVAAYVESAPGSIGAAPLAQAAVCRVATDGLAANDGSTWALATTLLSALGNANCDEIWVKAGVYKPVVPANAAAVTVPERAASFAINRPLKLYGGFAGTETALNGRVLSSFNKTVLSGDIDDNDSNKIDGITPDAGDIAGSNSYHVVVIGGLTGDGNCQYTDSNTVLDGLTITGGYANGAASGNPPHNWGGGLYCNGRGTGKASGPLLTHMAFIGNRAGDSGVAGYGGALYNDARFAGTSSPWLINVTFSGNAAAGTAIVNNASTASSVARPKLLNVTLYHLDDSTTVMENWGAESDQGTNKGVSFPVVYLSIVWGKIKNTEFPAGTGTYTGRATFLYSIVKNSGCPAGCDPSVGNFLLSSNLSGDPLLSAATDHGGGTWTMLPGAGSPALDSPETSCGHYSSGLGYMVTTDQRSVSRPQGTGCDIGAVEWREGYELKLNVGANGAIQIDGSAYPLTQSGPATVTMDLLGDSAGNRSSLRITATPNPGYHAVWPQTVTIDGATYGNACADSAASLGGASAYCYLTMDKARYAGVDFVNTYAVSYDGNGNTGGSVPATQAKADGVDLTLATNSGNLTRTGYTFAG